MAGVLSLAFPETNGKPMTETIDEAEDFYRNAKYISLYVKSYAAFHFNPPNIFKLLLKRCTKRFGTKIK